MCFSGMTGAVQRHRRERLVEGEEAEPEGTDAIENRVREESPGEKELNQSSSFDLTQERRTKPGERLLQGEEDDSVSHALHRVK